MKKKLLTVALVCLALALLLLVFTLSLVLIDAFLDPTGVSSIKVFSLAIPLVITTVAIIVVIVAIRNNS